MTRAGFNISEKYNGFRQLRCGRKISAKIFAKSSIGDPIVFVTPGYGDLSDSGKYPHKAK